MIRLDEPQAEAIVWLSSRDNAPLWAVVEKLIEDRLDAARKDLEQVSDTNHLFKKQGEVVAFRELADLRNKAEKLLNAKHS
jgi:hypothetical protein